MNPIKPFVGYAIGAAFLALALFAGVKQAQVWKLTADNARQATRIVQLEGINAALTTENENCAARVMGQNAAIEQLQAEAERRERAAAEALAAAERSAAKRLADAAAILSRPMPKPGDECGSLEVLINEMIEGRQQ